MTDERDIRLGRRLGCLGLPEHRPEYWSLLEMDVAAESEVLHQQRDHELGARLVALDLPHHGDEFWPALDERLRSETRLVRWRGHRRWPRIVAAAAATAAACFVGMAWFGLPVQIGGDQAIARIFLPPLQIHTSSAQLDGDRLLWMSRRGPNAQSGGADVNIYALDLVSNMTVAISAYPSWKQQVTASGKTVAWVDGRDGRPAIYINRGDVGDERLLAYIGPRRVPSAVSFTGEPADLHLGEPAISGETIVWTDSRGDILGADLTTGETFAVAVDYWPERQPAVSGDIVVWSDGRGISSGVFDTPADGWDIYARDLARGETQAISAARNDQLDPAIWGKVIVWQDGRNRTDADPDNWDIYGYDLTSGSEFAVTTAPGAQTNPTICGELVAWTDAHDAGTPAGSSVGYTTIQGYDLHSAHRFQISQGPGALDFASVSGNRVIWSSLQGDHGELAVYGATIVQHTGKVRAVPLER